MVGFHVNKRERQKGGREGGRKGEEKTNSNDNNSDDSFKGIMHKTAKQRLSIYSYRYMYLKV